MTKKEAEVVALWKAAAADLGFRFTSPFVITTPNGGEYEHLGLIHDFGRRIGTLVSVLGEPSAQVPRPTGEDYSWTIIGGPGSGRYERQLFIDILDDLQFFGSEADRPQWYSGKSWT